MIGKFIVIDGLDGVGKSTLVNNVKNKLNIDIEKVIIFSPSDLCKHGFEKTFGSIVDIDNYDKIVENIKEAIVRVKDALVGLDSYTKFKNENIFTYDAYTYNRIMDSYMELGRTLTPYLNILKDLGYIVIADRWMMSTLAYNYGVKKTYVSNLSKYKLRSNRWKNEWLLVDPKRHPKDDMDTEKYINIAEYIKKSMEAIIIPDVYIVLTDNLEVIVENINKRGNVSNFEKTDRLKRTLSMFYTLSNHPFEYTLDFIYNATSKVYTIKNVISELGPVETMNRTMNILKNNGIG